MYTKVERFLAEFHAHRVSWRQYALWGKRQTSKFKDNKLKAAVFMCRSSRSSGGIPENTHEEPAAYWSAPREHLSSPIFQQHIARGLTLQRLENAYLHEQNGDSLNMLAEVAVELSYADSIPPSPHSNQSLQSRSSPMCSLPTSSPLSSISPIFPPLEES